MLDSICSQRGRLKLGLSQHANRLNSDANNDLVDLGAKAEGKRSKPYLFGLPMKDPLRGPAHWSVVCDVENHTIQKFFEVRARGRTVRDIDEHHRPVRAQAKRARLCEVL